jgi:hypothetical protein
MYNMDISIFGYKLNLEILILIGIIYLILVGHTFCGCCNMGKIMETFTTASGNTVDPSGNHPLATQVAAGSTPNNVVPKAAGAIAAAKSNTANNGTTESFRSIEGFTGANTNYGESSQYDLTNDMPLDTSSWSAQNMTVTPGQPLSAGVKQFLARPQQQLPLPEGEMLFLANSKFSPECCPSTYSSSQGCWCGTSEDYNYLITRGGNNVPYSEY